MFFHILTSGLVGTPKACAYLVPDNWDDWFEFQTMFILLVCDEDGHRHQIGAVKIGEFGLQPSNTVEPGKRKPNLPFEFDELEPTFFSLGQGEDYYEALNELSYALRQKILIGLRDCANNLAVFYGAIHEPSMQSSLLRYVAESTVTGRLNRLAHGNTELSTFRFVLTTSGDQQSFSDIEEQADSDFGQPDNEIEELSPLRLAFDVIPNSEPPTNVHVLIGGNGVGKTRTLQNLVFALVGRSSRGSVPVGRVEMVEDGSDFVGLVLVSFSAFDSLVWVQDKGDRIPVTQVGLQSVADRGAPYVWSGEHRVKSVTALATDFSDSLEKCMSGTRVERWLDAIETLEADDLFAEHNVRTLAAIRNVDRRSELAKSLFLRLSSGHAIVLLTITRLVELVDEKTLVLFDEPEGHLHPPLLAAFIRCLSNLLNRRNGVAIVATHSPVILQEIPRTCVWKLRRSESFITAERPSIETFGENISILTREVFGLEVTKTGFHQLLRHAVFTERLSYEQLLMRFGNELGIEARAIVRALINTRERETTR